MPFISCACLCSAEGVHRRALGAGRANDIGSIIQSGQVTLSAPFFALLRNRPVKSGSALECGRTILHTASTGCRERRVHGIAILNHGHVVKLN